MRKPTIKEKNAFLGKGWAFPPKFIKGANDSGPEMVSAEKDICESLQILLSTKLGERVMRPNYGCNLYKLNFEPINTQFLAFVQTYIEQSILLHEPRVELENVNINTSSQLDGILYIEVNYRVRATNSPDNYVYPFYLNDRNFLNE
ncbi:MAG: GPW/gp25 family protein [Bacteroidia bacterium]|nr:GPW/gp25 family protein [Bacteroidia bacterium]